MEVERMHQQDFLDQSLGFPLNVHKTDRGGQMQTLFYEDFKVTQIRDRKSRQLTLNDDALDTISRREPILVPLIRTIQNIRSLDTNTANMIEPALRAGDRLRTCLNIAGPETFRFSSNETAFGEGTNLQNIQRPPSD
jgi:DNA polymerase I-like protein with 3'-5' exonuclease and polymerase domains